MLSSLVVQRPFSCKIRDTRRRRSVSPGRCRAAPSAAPAPLTPSPCSAARYSPATISLCSSRKSASSAISASQRSFPVPRQPPAAAGARRRAASSGWGRGRPGPVSLWCCRPSEAKRRSSGGPAGSPRRGTARRSRPPPPPGEGLPRLVWRRPKLLLRRERASHVSAFRSPLRRAVARTGAAGGSAVKGRGGEPNASLPCGTAPPYYWNGEGEFLIAFRTSLVYSPSVFCHCEPATGSAPAGSPQPLPRNGTGCPAGKSAVKHLATPGVRSTVR